MGDMKEGRNEVERLPSSLAALVGVFDMLRVTEVNGEVFRRFRGWSSMVLTTERSMARVHVLLN